VYVAYVVAHYGVMVGRYGTTVSL